MTNDEEVAWCRQLWESIRDGGVWAIPRTGLIFQKRVNPKQLVLTMRMPHDPAMECSAEELREQQDSDLRATREHFSLLDIRVTDETPPVPVAHPL